MFEGVGGGILGKTHKYKIFQDYDDGICQENVLINLKHPKLKHKFSVLKENVNLILKLSRKLNTKE